MLQYVICGAEVSSYNLHANIMIIMVPVSVLAVCLLTFVLSMLLRPNGVMTYSFY